MTPLSLNFDERKATAAGALILRQHDGTMEILRLIKLLYPGTEKLRQEEEAAAELERLRFSLHP